MLLGDVTPCSSVDTFQVVLCNYHCSSTPTAYSSFLYISPIFSVPLTLELPWLLVNVGEYMYQCTWHHARRLKCLSVCTIIATGTPELFLLWGVCHHLLIMCTNECNVRIPWWCMALYRGSLFCDFCPTKPFNSFKCSAGLIFMQASCLDNKAAIMNC